ncbi:MAG: glycosyltransferase family 4 protein [Chloroflexi bacterium]|nr:glycosyltransferase family 4 protein [Chloroflexota bacterium]
MKILYVVQAYHPSKGGVQWLIQNLAEQMALHDGDEVTIFTTTAYECQLFTDPSLPALPAGNVQINGVTVCRFNVFNKLTWLRLNAARVGYKLRLPGQDWLRCQFFGPIVPGLKQAIADSNADIIIASSFPMQHMYDALHGAHIAKIPIVFIGTVHPTDPWGYDLPRMYKAIKTANKYIALSTHEQDYLIAHGVPASHIQIIGGGVNADAFQNAEQAGTALRHRCGFGDDPVAVLIGRQTAYKRADLIISAMQQVWQTTPSARLLLAGARTSYSDELDQMIAKLPTNQQSHITMITDFAEVDKPAILAATDILLQPSERESFGIVFLEAWAAGKPVIGARSGASPTVIDEGKDGLLATYGDVDAWATAISQLLSDKAVRNKMGEAGRAKVYRRYTWRQVAHQLRTVLIDLTETTT